MRSYCLVCGENSYLNHKNNFNKSVSKQTEFNLKYKPFNYYFLIFCLHTTVSRTAISLILPIQKKKKTFLFLLQATVAPCSFT